MKMLLKQLLRLIFGEYCPDHNQHFRSDFCPKCIKARVIRQLTHDESKEWIKSEGSWPIRRE